MTDHTTHFDDCGCKSKSLEAERDALRLRVAALLPVARAAYHFTRGNGIDGELLADLCAQLAGFKSEDFDHE